MKKNLLLAIFAFAFSTFALGQLKVFVPAQSNTNPFNVSVSNGDTINMWGDPQTEMNMNLEVINTGASSITVSARRDSLHLPLKDTDNCFCWGGLCFPNTTDVSPPSYSETLTPGDTTFNPNWFQCHYFPYGHVGKYYIRYDFFNKNNVNSNDSAWVVVGYIVTPAGIQNTKSNSIGFFAPYPNPANSMVNFNYSLSSDITSATLKVFNLLGECVQTLPLSASKSRTTIDVQNMPSGIYVCEVEASGSRPAYQKLVVSH